MSWHRHHFGETMRVYDLYLRGCTHRGCKVMEIVGREDPR